MTRLAIVSSILGAGIIAVRLPGVIAPEPVRQWIRKFPRSVGWGRGLMFVVAAWAGINMFRAATDDWSWARPLIVIGMPAVYWLVIQFAPAFLAVRAAAALTLLVAKIVVDTADTSELTSRLVVTTLAYISVVAAMWMAAAPHRARDLIEITMASNARCRAVCGAGVAAGILLLALGLFVY